MIPTATAARSRSRTGVNLLSQYLIRCPLCSKPGAVHLDERTKVPVLIRFVCPDGCSVKEGEVLRSFAGGGGGRDVAIDSSSNCAGSSRPREGACDER